MKLPSTWREWRRVSGLYDSWELWECSARCSTRLALVMPVDGGWSIAWGSQPVGAHRHVSAEAARKEVCRALRMPPPPPVPRLRCHGWS